MIADSETNLVYCSDLSYKYLKKEVTELNSILEAYGIECRTIHGTVDYFCRDFMPIQKDLDTFVQFKFRPDYLLSNPKLMGFITDTEQVHKANPFLHHYDIIHSDIILDGGNVIKWKDKIIITDKVIVDNPNINPASLIDEIGKLLDSEVIIIPRYPDEETGHADGLVRFIDKNTVLTISLEDEIDEWKAQFQKALADANLKVISLPDSADSLKDSYWGYINFLLTGNLIVLPTFKYKSDDLMYDFFNDTFKGFEIKKFEADRIIKNGGVLNCFTWNIKA